MPTVCYPSLAEAEVIEVDFSTLNGTRGTVIVVRSAGARIRTCGIACHRPPEENTGKERHNVAQASPGLAA